MEDISFEEFLEVQVINSFVPTLFCQHLKPLFLKSDHVNKFIVNVSAMEGQFNRKTKNEFHPHTNMAKAALNMLTRTAGLSYKNDNIWVWTAIFSG